MEQFGERMAADFFGVNFAHPYQSPTLSPISRLLCNDDFPVFPRADVWANVKRVRHSVVIFSVMMVLMIGNHRMGDLPSTP